ncbi:MAG: hypothetical protein ACFFCQ_12115 [Promethearchaeota archaeon]
MFHLSNGNIEQVDILIVGLGPAGASTLKTLAQISDTQSFKILAIDRRAKIGIPVNCGEFLPSPGTLGEMFPNITDADDLFHFDDRLIAQRTKRLAFISPEGKVTSISFEGVTIHRDLWLQDIVKQAERFSNITVLRKTSLKQITNDSWHITRPEGSRTINPKIIVGADGVNSQVRRHLWGKSALFRDTKDYVNCREYLMNNLENHDSSEVGMYFGQEIASGAFAWIIPKGPQAANVGIGIRNLKKCGTTLRKALDCFITSYPHSSPYFSDATIQKTYATRVPVAYPLQKTVEKNAVLIGNAASQTVGAVGAGIPPAIILGNRLAPILIDHLTKNRPLTDFENIWRADFLDVLLRSRKLRGYYDKIQGSDKRMNWYFRRFKESDLQTFTLGRINWRMKLVFPFTSLINFFFRL